MTVTDIQAVNRKYDNIRKKLNALEKNIALLNENVLEIKQDRKRMTVKQVQDDRVFVDMMLELKGTINSLNESTMLLIARVDKLEDAI